MLLLEDLPLEAIAHIFNFCDVLDVWTLANLSHKLNTAKHYYLVKGLDHELLLIKQNIKDIEDMDNVDVILRKAHYIMKDTLEYLREDVVLEGQKQKETENGGKRTKHKTFGIFKANIPYCSTMFAVNWRKSLVKYLKLANLV